MIKKVIAYSLPFIFTVVLVLDCIHVIRAINEFTVENLAVHMVAWIGGFIVVVQNTWCIFKANSMPFVVMVKLFTSFILQMSLVIWIALTSLAYWKGYSVFWVIYILPALIIALLMFLSIRTATNKKRK